MKKSTRDNKSFLRKKGGESDHHHQASSYSSYHLVFHKDILQTHVIIHCISLSCNAHWPIIRTLNKTSFFQCAPLNFKKGEKNEKHLQLKSFHPPQKNMHIMPHLLPEKKMHYHEYTPKKYHVFRPRKLKNISGRRSSQHSSTPVIFRVEFSSIRIAFTFLVCVALA